MDGGSELSSFSSNEVRVVQYLSNSSLTSTFRDAQLVLSDFFTFTYSSSVPFLLEGGGGLFCLII